MSTNLTTAKIEDSLYRIISGKIEYDGSYIRDPSFSVKKEGKKAYLTALEDFRFDTLQDRDIYILLLESGQWSPKDEARLKSLPNEIENNKLDYFQNFHSPEKKRMHRGIINNSMGEFVKLNATRHKYSNMTLEGIANGAMWYTMIQRMYGGSDKLMALAYYHNTMVDEDTIRDIALSHEWNSYSGISKNPLRKAPVNMTDLQRKLYSWTNVYRNVRTHPDCPADAIIEDHLAFDGWLINQNRKDRAGKVVKVQLKNLKPNAQNVYVPTKTTNDIQDVMSLNDAEARAKMGALFGKVKNEQNSKN